MCPPIQHHEHHESPLVTPSPAQPSPAHLADQLRDVVCDEGLRQSIRAGISGHHGQPSRSLQSARRPHGPRWQHEALDCARPEFIRSRERHEPTGRRTDEDKRNRAGWQVLTRRKQLALEAPESIRASMSSGFHPTIMPIRSSPSTYLPTHNKGRITPPSISEPTLPQKLVSLLSTSGRSQNFKTWARSTHRHANADATDMFQRWGGARGVRRLREELGLPRPAHEAGADGLLSRDAQSGTWLWNNAPFGTNSTYNR